MEIKFHPVDAMPEKKPGRKKGTGKWGILLRQFVESEHPLVEIDADGKSRYMVQKLHRALRVLELPVKIHQRDGHVFLERVS